MGDRFIVVGQFLVLTEAVRILGIPPEDVYQKIKKLHKLGAVHLIGNGEKFDDCKIIAECWVSMGKVITSIPGCLKTVKTAKTVKTVRFS